MKVLIISTGGTISACESPDSSGPSSALARVDDETGKVFSGALQSVFGEDALVLRPYLIDSQRFNLSHHGNSILSCLSDNPGMDVLVTTGTDTVKWLSNLIGIAEREAGFARRVVILSSMMNQSQEGGALHINGILNAGKAMLLASHEEVPKGVYVASAQNESASEVNFLSITNESDRVAKLSSDGLGSIVGSNIAFRTIEGKIERVEKDEAQEAALVKEGAEKAGEVAGFCGGARMTLFPTLAGSDPTLIAGYYAELAAGELAICEIDRGWVDGPNYDSYQGMIRSLAARDIKVILCNRSHYDAAPEERLSKEAIESLERSCCASGLVKIYDSLPTTSLYTKLAFAPDSLKMEVAGAAGAAAKREESAPDVGVAESARLGIRYVPDFKMFERSYGKVCDAVRGSDKAVLEALVCGVIPHDLLEIISEVQKIKDCAPSLVLTSSYQQKSGELKYEASAKDSDLSVLRIEREGIRSARQILRNELVLVDPRHGPSPVAAPFGADTLRPGAELTHGSL